MSGEEFRVYNLKVFDVACNAHTCLANRWVREQSHNPCQRFGFRISVFGFRDSGFGFQYLGFGFARSPIITAKVFENPRWEGSQWLQERVSRSGVPDYYEPYNERVRIFQLKKYRQVKTWSTLHMPTPTLRVAGFASTPIISAKVSGLEFRVSSSEFQVSGFGFRVSGFGFRVSGFSGFRVLRSHEEHCLPTLLEGWLCVCA